MALDVMMMMMREKVDEKNMRLQHVTETLRVVCDFSFGVFYSSGKHIFMESVQQARMRIFYVPLPPSQTRAPSYVWLISSVIHHKSVTGGWRM